MTKLNRGLSVWQNHGTSSVKFTVSYEKYTTKDSKAKQLIKLYQTKPNRTTRNPLFEMAHWMVLTRRPGDAKDGRAFYVLVART